MLKDRSYCFGPFVLFADRAILYCEEKPVRIGSRAIEILTALVERAGTIVSGEDLIARTWPDTHVEENTLRVHLVSLRKVLASESECSQYIVNVPGRGYRFVQPVRSENGCVVSARIPLPEQPLSVFGRSQDVAAVLHDLQSSRLLNIVGSGACGKTSVALVAAHSTKERFADGIIFVDLSSISDDREVIAAIARAMAVKLSTDTERDLLCQLQNMEALMVLDNCEHVLERVALFLKRLLQRAPAVRILATSQEALMIEHEIQYRLSPLGYPKEPNTICSADAALSYPSIQLFMHSAKVAGTGYEMTHKDAPIIAAICKHLEGKPLYIELAASAVACCTPAELLRDLGLSFSALVRGQRTAPVRQKTLRCSLDWGFKLLSPEEQKFLVCLALFDQPFDRNSAMLLADFSGKDAGLAFELFSSLVAKFWLTPTRESSGTTFSLSFLTMLYLREKFCTLENADDIRQRYVKFVLPALKQRKWTKHQERQQGDEEPDGGFVWNDAPRDTAVNIEKRSAVRPVTTTTILRKATTTEESISLSRGRIDVLPATLELAPSTSLSRKNTGISP